MKPATAAIFGATSSIARWSALELARAGWDLVLCGRDLDELDRVASDLMVRTGRTVTVEAFRADEPNDMERVWSLIRSRSTDLCGLLVAFGELGDQVEQNEDPRSVRPLLDINFTSPAMLIQFAARDFEAEGRGWILAIGSVAGDRGRASNYVYGAAKSGLATFVEGLRIRLASKGVRVVLVKPGFIDTPMTFGKTPFAADPRVAGARIVKALEDDRGVIYVPGFWRLIMGIIRSIPDFVFKRLKL